MRHIHISCDDDRLCLFQFFQISPEIILPLHPIIQPCQLVLGIGSVHCDKIKIFKLTCDHTSLLVMLLDPDPVCDRYGLFFCKDRCPGVSFAHCIIPVLVIPFQIQRELPLLHLCLLDAEDIRIRLFKEIQESFLDARPDPVYIPRYQFHCLYLTSFRNRPSAGARKPACCLSCDRRASCTL